MSYRKEDKDIDRLISFFDNPSSYYDLLNMINFFDNRISNLEDEVDQLKVFINQLKQNNKNVL